MKIGEPLGEPFKKITVGESLPSPPPPRHGISQDIQGTMLELPEAADGCRRVDMAPWKSMGDDGAPRFSCQAKFPGLAVQARMGKTAVKKTSQTFLETTLLQLIW